MRTVLPRKGNKISGQTNRCPFHHANTVHQKVCFIKHMGDLVTFQKLPKKKRRKKEKLPNGCGLDTELFWVCIVKAKIALKELLTSTYHMLHRRQKNNVNREEA